LRTKFSIESTAIKSDWSRVHVACQMAIPDEAVHPIGMRGMGIGMGADGELDTKRLFWGHSR